MADTNNQEFHKKNLKILFWNARSFNQRRTELLTKLHEYDVCICVESWLTNKDSVHFPGFVTFRQDRQQSRGGGIIILIRKNLAFKRIENIVSPDSSVELCGIYLNNVKPALNLIICYRTPGLLLTQDQWDTILSNANLDNVILLGDFNAHNTLWNCKFTDSNGTKFYKSIHSHNLFVHNYNTFTHIDTHRNYKSNIDLVLSSLDISNKINVIACDETWGSDHFPLSLEISIEKYHYKKETFKLKSVSTNWARFEKHLEYSYEKFLCEYYDTIPSNEKYCMFFDTVVEAVVRATPRKKLSNTNNIVQSNPVSWWDAECDSIKKLRRAAFKKWERTLDLNDLIDYKKYCALAKKTFKSKKKADFVNFCENLDFRVDCKRVWNKCRIFKDRWTKASNPSTEQNLQTKNQIDAALDKISPPWAETDPSSRPQCQENPFLSSNFTFAELNVALDSKNKKSAPGIDGVDFEILQNLTIKYKLLLLDIFNELYTSHMYPESWKHSFVNFIPKSDGSSFRPISLTSCMCKLFETLIRNRLQRWAETNDIIPVSQSGFRAGNSCINNLTNLALTVKEAFLDNAEVLAVFLDVKGAFDNVCIDILLEKLAEISCPSNLINFIHFLMHARFIHTNSPEDKVRSTYKGVPQGGVLSPLLFILYVATITNSTPKTVQISQYADDIAIYTKFRTIKRGKNLTEKTLKIIENNLFDLGLELAPNKTQVIHFNNKKIPPGNVEICISGIPIKSTHTVPFLGLIFDYQLSFTAQINNVINKCSRTLNIIKFLCGTWWGSDPETLLVLYKSYIRSKIDYASFIYHPTKITLANKLESIQFSAIRTALGYRISTPKNILLAESNLPTLAERAKEIGSSFLLKCFSHEKCQTKALATKVIRKCKKRKKNLNSIFYDCLQYVNKHSTIIDSSQKLYMYCHNHSTILLDIFVNYEFGKSLGKTLNRTEEFNTHLVKSNALSIYTDGSKTPEGVGSACICPDTNSIIQRSIDKNASVFTAECIALNDALTLSLRFKNKNIDIYTDSLSVLQAISTKTPTAKTNKYILDIKKKFSTFHKNNESAIKLFWVPAHCGIPGNEQADQLAKDAALFNDIDIKTIPYSDLYYDIKKTAYFNTTNSIKNGNTGKLYFELFFKENKKPWFKGKGLSRYFIVTINRIRANHYNLPY